MSIRDSSQSVSQILINARTQNERLYDILRNVKNIRIQLDGEFPNEIDCDKAAELPGLIGSIIDLQERQDALIGSINTHMDVIHDKLGTLYHPNSEDEAKK